MSEMDEGQLASLVINHTPAMVAYWDASLHCRFSNDAYSDWFGKSRQQMDGIAMRDALGEVFEQNRLQIDAVLAGARQVFERAVTVADGTLRHSLMSYTPHLVQGQVAGFFVHVADVTPLKRAEYELKSANAELQATQILLADAIRESERVRIARDMHDTLGHELTALNLHLELALRQGDDGPQAGALQTARALGQGLLASVRAVVALEHSNHIDDLRQALASLCAAIPTPKVELDFGHELAIDCPKLAHTIFRCVQEAITNAIRHSGARQMQVHLGRSQGGLTVLIGDDGKGAANAKPGNGLRGMRERVTELGGRMRTASRPEGGFDIQLWLPVGGKP